MFVELAVIGGNTHTDCAVAFSMSSDCTATVPTWRRVRAVSFGPTNYEQCLHLNEWVKHLRIGETRFYASRIHEFKNEVTSCAAPQDSVLSPLLFLLYTNDISYSSNQLNFFLFADDTNLLYAIKNLHSLELTVNKELTIPCNWLLTTKVSLNSKKWCCHFPTIQEMNELRRNHKTLWPW